MRYKLWAMLLISVLSAAIAVVTSGMLDVGTMGIAAAAKQRLATLGVVAIGAVLIPMAFIMAFTLFLVRRERGPSRLAKLKNELASAYLSALDSSAFNPHVEDSR